MDSLDVTAVRRTCNPWCPDADSIGDSRKFIISNFFTPEHTKETKLLDVERIESI